MLGTLEGILNSISKGMLITVEDLIIAEAFDDILEQGEYLFQQGYLLAAGVLGRAVLEEHLRKWCGRTGCMPQKAKPTLDDYKSALYSIQAMDKVTMKHVEAMAAVGNDAAHAKQVQKEDIERFITDVRQFLVRHPLP